MTYALVDFTVPLGSLRREKSNAERNGIFDPVAFDQGVLRAAAGLVTQALEILDQYHCKIDTHHQAAKKTIHDMEDMIRGKGKQLNDRDVAVLETSAKFTRTAAEQLATESKESVTALAQFRGNWEAAYKELLSKPVLVEPLLAARAKSIEEGKARDSLKKRVEEYVTRATDLLRAAKQAVSKGSVLAGKELDEIKEFKAQLDACERNYETYAQKARNSLKQLADLNPKTKPTAAEQKVNQSRLVNGPAEAKNARGVLKTMRLKVESFQDLVPKMGQPHIKVAHTAAETARRRLVAITTDAAELSELEAKALKVMEAIRKLK